MAGTMARQREYAKKVKARREARKKKSKDKKGGFLKGLGKKLGVGVGKKEWEKGAPERKTKREASKAKSAKKAKENAAKAKKGPVYKSKKSYSAEKPKAKVKSVPKKKAKKDLWHDVIKPAAKKAGVGVGKKEWKKGEPERKAKRKASMASSAERAKANAAKAKKGPVYKVGKYQAGGQVPGNDEAVLEAAQMGQELESIPLRGVESDFPTSNAQDRSQTYRLGGAVKPPTTPSIQPPQYKKGGPVDITDVVKKVGKKVAQEKRHDKWIAEADKKKETIKSGAEVYPMSDKLKYEKKGHSAVKKDQIKRMTKKILKKKRGK